MVALVGTFNADRLVHHDPAGCGTLLREEAGGLAYSLMALGRLRPKWHLRPVAFMADGHADLFRHVLAAAGVDASALVRVPGEGNAVTLDCRREDKPEEARLVYAPLAAHHLEAALSCDTLLLNCTSGRDVDPREWDTFRRRWREAHPTGWLQMDWHSLSLDWEPGRARRLRRVPDAFHWVKDLDLLQMTLHETGSVVGRPPQRLEDAVDLALRLRKAGCRRVVISDGARGFLFVDGAGPRRQDAWPLSSLVDTTGCGDVLGAALLATLGAGWQVEKALPLAAQVAGACCAAAGLGSLEVVRAVEDGE